MKNLLVILGLIVMFTVGANSFTLAQNTNTGGNSDTTATENLMEEDEEMSDEQLFADDGEEPFHQQLKTKFIEGGAIFMGFVLVSFILGLAFTIERILYLNFSTTNTGKLIRNIENALETGGIDAAKEICRNTRGPVASIFYQGLDRAHEGIDVVEKSVISYGGVQMSLLEKNLPWISLMIALAPMLGFLGTVIGMVQAFDAIQAAGDISPSLVAGGIKVALITTIGGLIVAIILQMFYNYLLSKIDSMTIQMEDASISLIDLLVKYELKNK